MLKAEHYFPGPQAGAKVQRFFDGALFRQQLGQDAAEQLFPGSDDEEGAEFSPDGNGNWILYWSTPYGASPPPTTQRLSSSDGRHLYFTQMMWESNAWLLENF